MDSDAEHYVVDFALVPIHVRDRLLKLDRRTERSHRAHELGQHTVACQLDYAAAIPSKRWFETIAAPLLQPQQRAALVAAHEPRIPRDVGRHDGRQFAPLAFQRDSRLPIAPDYPQSNQIVNPAVSQRNLVSEPT
jgi:hypothetical protein